MEIGEPVKKFVVEPLREPIPQREVEPEAIPVEPVEQPEPVHVTE